MRLVELHTVVGSVGALGKSTADVTSMHVGVAVRHKHNTELD